MDTKNENKTLRREDVLAMQAGPEMDALLLERLFTPEQAVDIMQKHGTAHLVVYADGKTRNEVRPPKFSTDIAAAWLVVERLTSRGNPMFMELDWHSPAVSGDGYAKVSFRAIYALYATAESVPLAIGRAALLTTVE